MGCNFILERFHLFLLLSMRPTFAALTLHRVCQTLTLSVNGTLIFLLEEVTLQIGYVHSQRPLSCSLSSSQGSAWRAVPPLWAWCRRTSYSSGRRWRRGTAAPLSCKTPPSPRCTPPRSSLCRSLICRLHHYLSLLKEKHNNFTALWS